LEGGEKQTKSIAAVSKYGKDMHPRGGCHVFSPSKSTGMKKAEIVDCFPQKIGIQCCLVGSIICIQVKK
jgi:hypothetical protein